MNQFDDLPPHLRQLGHELVAAAEHRNEVRRRPARRWRPTRPLALGIATAAVAIPGVAFAATEMISANQVATGLAAANAALVGTHPSCTVVQANAEYRCTLPDAPSASHPAQFSVMERPGGGGIMVEIADHGQTQAVRMRGGVLPDYAHVLSAAEEIARENRSDAKTVTTRTTASVPTPVTNWTGTIELTVDATRHVIGACRASSRTGTEWDCYIGEAAVTHRLIAKGLLGQYAPTPTVG